VILWIVPDLAEDVFSGKMIFSERRSQMETGYEALFTY